MYFFLNNIQNSFFMHIVKEAIYNLINELLIMMISVINVLTVVKDLKDVVY